MDFRIVKIDDIKVNREERFREDLGDLSGMVQTLKDGLYIQPISVDEKMVLIAGERRLQAHKLAGLTELVVRVWPGLTEKQKLEVQHIENEQRKELKPSEKAKAYKAIKASEPSNQGRRSDLKVHEPDDSTSRQMARSSKTPTKEEKRLARMAKQANFGSDQEARRTEKVLDHSPAEIMSAVDAGIVTVSDAAKVSNEPAEKQLKALERVKAGQAKTLKAGLAEPKQTQKARAAVRAAKNHQPASEDSDPELDCCGRVIPSVLSQVRADSVALTEYSRLLSELQKLLADMKMDGYRCAHLNLQTPNHAQNLKFAIDAAIFHCVCVYCEGKNQKCTVCKGAGWCNKDTWASAPREKKKVS